MPLAFPTPPTLRQTASNMGLESAVVLSNEPLNAYLIVLQSELLSTVQRIEDTTIVHEHEKRGKWDQLAFCRPLPTSSASPSVCGGAFPVCLSGCVRDWLRRCKLQQQSFVSLLSSLIMALVDRNPTFLSGYCSAATSDAQLQSAAVQVSRTTRNNKIKLYITNHSATYQLTPHMLVP